MLTVGIYSLKWEGKTTTSVVEILPFPVARVGTHWIRYSDYLENVRSQRQFYEKQDFSVVGRTIDFTTKEGELQFLELKRVVLWRMIERELIRVKLEERGIVVTTADVEREFERRLLEVGNRQTITANIRDFYGWSLTDFRNRFVEPQIEREYLEESLRNDTERWGDARKKAEEVMASLKRGEDFSSLAKRYSDDATTVDRGGDLGVLKRRSGQLASGQFDAVIFDQLAEGESSGILKSELGYHIVKVVERVDVDSVRVSHILIYPTDFQDWLERECEGVPVRVLLHDYQWRADEFELFFTDSQYEGIRDQFYPENPSDPLQ